MKRQDNGSLLWGVVVETEAYSQDDPATRGYSRRTPSNETLFGEPGRFYVVVSYGIHHCVKRVNPRQVRRKFPKPLNDNACPQQSPIRVPPSKLLDTDKQEGVLATPPSSPKPDPQVVR